MLRYSKQREAILQNLRTRKDHPSADMVYDSLRRDHPNISLGTVYRNLTLLSEQGEILRLRDQDKDRFDGDVRPHMHFFCEHCGRIADVFTPLPNDCLTKAAEEAGFAIQRADVSLRGICKTCLKT